MSCRHLHCDADPCARGVCKRHYDSMMRAGRLAAEGVRMLRRSSWPLPVPPLPERPRLSWRDDAACEGMDVDLFYPSPRKGTSPVPAREVIEACSSCPVRASCLVDALSLSESADDGVRGGMGPGDRLRLRRRLSRREAA